MGGTGTLTKNRRSALVLLLAATLVVGAPAQQALANGDSKHLLSLTNQARKDAGLQSLKQSKKVARYALKHSKAMANEGSLFHTSDLGSVLKGIGWQIAGENVGEGPSVDDIQSAFMSSSQHKKNILKKSYDHAGVGAYTDGDGTVWVTVIFYGS